jgi:tripartite-type tricarboxylate transporter receptor subunit TctC
MKSLSNVFGLLLFSLALGVALPPAFAQGYPVKPVRIIVPFPPGGGTDILARMAAAKLGSLLGQQFIVDNRSGAGGALGTEFSARAVADGYTLLFNSSSPLSIGPHLVRKPAYDPLRDFAPVILVASAPNVLVIHPSVPARSVKELIVLAKQRPGELNYASNGAGTLSHLTGELFKQRAGVDMVHVPYKGGPPAVTDTMAGHTSALFAAFPTVSPQVRAGRLRAIAVSSSKRAAMAPDVPAVSETLPGFESVQWWGMFGPAGMSADIVERLNTVMQKVLTMDDVRKRLAADAAEPIGGTPADFARFMSADYGKWGKVVQSIGIRTD